MVSPQSKGRRRRRGRQSKVDSQGETLHQNPLLSNLTDHWYNEYTQTESVKNNEKDTDIESLRLRAQSLFEQEMQLSQKIDHQKDDAWMESTIKSGTLRDKIAAMAVVVSTHPIYSLPKLDGLLSLAASTNSRIAQLASDALQDLFIELLPPDRKLRTKPNGDERKNLVLWHFEGLLANKYNSFLTEYLSRTLRHGTSKEEKLHALRMAGNLLRQRPHAEANLLSLVVNKLGDMQVAATASNELFVTLEEHSAMQTIVAREVQQLAHRPGLAPKALSNCLNFLNQLTLRQGTELPGSLMRTYLSLLKVAQGQSRLLSALLMGVNRARVYVKDDSQIQEHIDQLYQIVHQAPPAAATQALLLLFHVQVGVPDGEQVTPSKQTNRFYRVLFQACGRAELLTQGSGKHLTMLFNLLYKALKYSPDPVPLAKRITATTMHASAPIASATMLLIKAVADQSPSLQSSMSEVLEGDDALRVLDVANRRDPRGALMVFRTSEEGDKESNDQRSSRQSKEDESKNIRAPLWELALLSHHAHPSVRQFCRESKLHYTGDPLRDFGLAHFLDKFAYRNPKKDTTRRQTTVTAARRSKQRGPSSLPLNDSSFLKKESVDAPDEFFRIFFTERARRQRGVDKRDQKEEKNTDDEGEEELQSDEDSDDEGSEVSHTVNFDELEEKWGSDPEEEAYVDSLAEQIIEDALHEHGPVDIDDDPDFEDWDDETNGNEGEDEVMEGNSEDYDVEDGGDGDGNGDDFMDDSGSSSTEASGDNEDNFALLADASSADEEVSLDNKGRKRDFGEDTFADSEKYDKMIEESFTELIEQQLSKKRAKGSKVDRKRK